MTKIDVDQLSLQLTEALRSREDLSKGIPPKLYYRLRSWLKRMRPENAALAGAGEAMTEKFETAIYAEKLHKNEFAASVFEGGQVRLDFGADVPDTVKEAALRWAKRRGLRPVEASLQKSSTGSSSITFATGADSALGTCLRRVTYNL